MPWIMFALAVGCFAVAINTQSMGLALLCLLAALGLMLSGALAIISARIQRSSHDGGAQLNPALERHRLKQTMAKPDAEPAAVAAPAALTDVSDVER
ncbi:hypothetical protein [Pseudomarimonas arenosa]|uniref:Uncharacterized protein n=1 Tax=Pseudomarimonas arenosa TaxID=2774145 RepID=A0AAW3ZQF6_9GAMM|nr:hypothetical protein [Pseudomarimonas arenosa]MBD8527963.1 hypothetical protein [Pseudomarimonas arenosa]